MILITGGAGFIGSNFAHQWLSQKDEPVLNLDKLTYAGNINNLAALISDPRHVFVHGDIGNKTLVTRLLAQYKPRAIINFAAETHVDRSIRGPGDFIQTNVVGTGNLLEACQAYWSQLDAPEQAAFRFLHISTDEVYGDLGPDDAAFTECHPCRPNSPYSASKAASDHMVRAWHQTYGLPVLTTHCSNNYGPYHFPEKLIPLCISNALAGDSLPIYGDGLQIRDWLHVEDHCTAVSRVLEAGTVGQTYNIGGRNEMRNIDVVRSICSILDRLQPRADGQSYARQIKFVKDRAGHDRRYAVDASKIARELGWQPAESFETGIEKTLSWYLENADWVNNVKSGAYLEWMNAQYGT